MKETDNGFKENEAFYQTIATKLDRVMLESIPSQFSIEEEINNFVFQFISVIEVVTVNCKDENIISMIGNMQSLLNILSNKISRDTEQTFNTIVFSTQKLIIYMISDTMNELKDHCTNIDPRKFAPSTEILERIEEMIEISCKIPHSLEITLNNVTSDEETYEFAMEQLKTFSCYLSTLFLSPKLVAYKSLSSMTQTIKKKIDSFFSIKNIEETKKEYQKLKEMITMLNSALRIDALTAFTTSFEQNLDSAMKYKNGEHVNKQNIMTVKLSFGSLLSTFNRELSNIEQVSYVYDYCVKIQKLLNSYEKMNNIKAAQIKCNDIHANTVDLFNQIIESNFEDVSDSLSLILFNIYITARKYSTKSVKRLSFTKVLASDANKQVAYAVSRRSHELTFDAGVTKDVIIANISSCPYYLIDDINPLLELTEDYNLSQNIKDELNLLYSLLASSEQRSNFLDDLFIESTDNALQTIKKTVKPKLVEMQKSASNESLSKYISQTLKVIEEIEKLASSTMNIQLAVTLTTHYKQLINTMTFVYDYSGFFIKDAQYITKKFMYRAIINEHILYCLLLNSMSDLIISFDRHNIENEEVLAFILNMSKKLAATRRIRNIQWEDVMFFADECKRCMKSINPVAIAVVKNDKKASEEIKGIHQKLQCFAEFNELLHTQSNDALFYIQREIDIAIIICNSNTDTALLSNDIKIDKEYLKFIVNKIIYLTNKCTTNDEEITRKEIKIGEFINGFNKQNISEMLSELKVQLKDLFDELSKHIR